ncbi:MAG: hypothetical protein HFE63_05850 [Clostridiales bacterium]|nr:hypothetical protein [Clostridiales bacterium]
MLKKMINTIIVIITIILLVSCQESGSNEILEPDVDYLYIVKDGLSDFWVIRNDFAKGVDVEVAVGIRRAIADRTGLELSISTDWEKNPVYEHEIIVGKTLRESDEFKIDRIALGESGYIIKEINGKIYISGGADKGTQLAYKYFVDNFLNIDGDIRIPVGYERIVYHQYDIPEMYIDMKRVDNTYRIVLMQGADKNYTEAAKNLQQAIYDKTGVMLEIKTGSIADKNAFILSDAAPNIIGIHDIEINETSMIFKTSASSGIKSCVNIFIEKYLQNVYGNYNFPTDFRYCDLGDTMIVIYPNK